MNRLMLQRRGVKLATPAGAAHPELTGSYFSFEHEPNVLHFLAGCWRQLVGHNNPAYNPTGIEMSPEVWRAYHDELQLTRRFTPSDPEEDVEYTLRYRNVMATLTGSVSHWWVRFRTADGHTLLFRWVGGESHVEV